MNRSVSVLSCALGFLSIGLVATLVTAGNRGGGKFGACCYPDGSCADQVIQKTCESAGGSYQGDGSSCANPRSGVQCAPLGACCTNDQGCIDDVSQDYCESELTGVWYGQGTFCLSQPTLNGFGEGFSRAGGVNCDGVENDTCEDALHIDSLGMPEFGTVFGASIDFIPDCEPDLRGLDKYGVWYTVTGTGSVLQASVCGLAKPDRGIQDARSVLFIYCGGCENLQCVAGDGGRLLSCSERTLDPVQWCSVLGEEYLIFVALEDEITEDFLLTVEDTGQPCEGLSCNVPNDECEGAIDLAVGDFVTGNTFNATASLAMSCTIESERGFVPDVWYRVIGTGFPMEAYICKVDDFREGKDIGGLDVYCGTCDNLSCVDGMFDLVENCVIQNRGDGVYVEWCSEEGREYFIRVSWPEIQGDFGLEVDDSGKPCEPEPCGTAANDFCEDAQPICPGIIYTGDTFEATNDYLDHGAPISTVFFCGALMALYDNWYTYTPAESGLLFVHVEQLPVEWVFGVYSDCPENGGQLLNCNYQRHHGVIVSPVNAYQTYYIRIAGFLESRGTYFMDILGPPCVQDMPIGNTLGTE